MSEILVRSAFDRGSDFATKNDVAAIVRAEIVAIFGPTAKLTTEMCDRICAIEDRIVAAWGEPVSSRPNTASVATVSRDSGDAD